MNSRLLLAALGTGLCCATLAQAGTFGPKPDSIRKIIHAKVRIAPDGSVAEVAMAEKKVPPVIETAILARVKGWHFDPVVVDGKPVGAVTWAAFYSCAKKAGDGYDLAVKYIDNGPLLSRGALLDFQPVVVDYSKPNQTITVKMTVLANGRARLDDVAMLDVAPGIERDIRLSVKHWVEDMRYEPEQIDGKPVETPMETPLWIWADRGLPSAPDKPDLYAPNSSDPCDVLTAERNMPRAADGKFKPSENGKPVAAPPAK